MNSSKKKLQPASNSLKLKFASFTLIVFSFWHIFYCMLLILENKFEAKEEKKSNLLPIVSMFLLPAFSFFTYLIYRKYFGIINYFNGKIAIDTMIAIWYFIIICYLYIYPLTYFNLKRANSSEFIQFFINVVILANLFLIYIQNMMAKLFLSICLIFSWFIIMCVSNGFSSSLDASKLIIQNFGSLSMIIIYFLYMRQSKKSRFSKDSIPKSPIKLNQSLNPLENDPILFKFLNSLNSGILLYDNDMNLLFFNKKMRKFLYKKREFSKLSSEFKEKSGILMDKNTKELLSNSLFKLKNIKFFSLDDDEGLNGANLNEKEINSSVKSFLHSITNRSQTSQYFSKSSQKPSNFSFQNLLNTIKAICKDLKHPLLPVLKDRYLLFSYILDNTFKPNASFDNSAQTSFCQNSQIKYIELRVSMIPYQESYNLLFEFSNETQRKKINELNAINEHKTKILSHVAHEFRTPLNSIIGNLELMQEMIEIPLEIKDNYLKPGLFSSTLLLNYVNDILDFSQMRSNKLKMNYISFNILEHIETISQTMGVLAKKKHILFIKEIEPNLPRKITSDPNRLTQILLNLLSNAFKFASPENGIVKLKVSSISPSIRFEISDNGIGISEENLKKLFKEFGKIDSEQNQLLNPTGVGLGLLISQKFAEELSPPSKKGFEVTSEIGKGTCFAFSIGDKLDLSNIYKISPLSARNKTYNDLSSNRVYEEEEEQKVIENKNKNLMNFQQKSNNLSFNYEKSSSDNISALLRVSRDTTNNRLFSPLLKELKCFPISRCICPRILVVDDDMFNVSCLQNTLKMLGYNSEFAINGEDAIKKMKIRLLKRCCDSCKVFKLVLMDSEMPILNGEKATVVIKAMSQYENLIVIGLTGHSSPEQINSFLEAGADKVLTKPINKLKIMDILSNYKELLEE